MGPKDQIKVIKLKKKGVALHGIPVYKKKQKKKTMQFVKTSYMMSTFVNVYYDVYYCHVCEDFLHDVLMSIFVKVSLYGT